jgi:hypothetical protein
MRAEATTARRRRARRAAVPGALIRVAVLLATAGCAPPTVDGFAPSYDPTALTGGLVYRWRLGRTISLYVDPAALPGDVDLALLAQVAAGRWAASLGYRELRTRVTSSPIDADILIRDPDAPLVADTAGCGGPRWSDAAGSTVFCPAGDSARTLALPGPNPGRIKVIVTVDRDAVPAPAAFEAILLHELGHAFGIGGHSDDILDVMAPVPAALAPTPRDVRTLRYIVHQPPDISL